MQTTYSPFSKHMTEGVMKTLLFFFSRLPADFKVDTGVHITVAWTIGWKSSVVVAAGPFFWIVCSEQKNAQLGRLFNKPIKRERRPVTEFSGSWASWAT